MTAFSSTTALWYASRATGVVALGLLTAVMVLGLMVAGHGRLPGLPRFGVTGLHRNLSLLALAFVAVHVVTAIADPYVTIGVAAAIIPFTSPYETFWVGLGAVTLDLIIALVVTSLARVAIGRRAWRAVHWLAYATWPVAFTHGLTAAKDLRSGMLLVYAIGCAVVVVAAVTWRAARSLTSPRRAQRARRTAPGAPRVVAAGGSSRRPGPASRGSRPAPREFSGNGSPGTGPGAAPGPAQHELRRNSELAQKLGLASSAILEG